MSDEARTCIECRKTCAIVFWCSTCGRTLCASCAAKPFPDCATCAAWFVKNPPPEESHVEN